MKRVVSLILAVLMLAMLLPAVTSFAAATVVSARLNTYNMQVTVVFTDPVDASFAVYPSIYIANTEPEWFNIDGEADDVTQPDPNTLVLHFTNGAQSEMNEGPTRLIMTAACGVFDVGTDEHIERVSIIVEKYYEEVEDIDTPDTGDTPDVDDPFALPAYTPKTFPDIQGRWFQNVVEFMAGHGYVNGQSADVFAPQSTMTRAEFLAVLVRITGKDGLADAGSFADVDDTKWYASEIKKAKANGIALDSDGANFRPTEPVLREEAFVWVSRAIGLYDASADDIAAFRAAFTDNALVADFALPGTAALFVNGYVQGSDGKINPKGTMTRAEGCQVLYNVIQSMI